MCLLRLYGLISGRFCLSRLADGLYADGVCPCTELSGCQLECRFAADVAGRCADQCFECAGLCHPILLCIVIETQRFPVDRKRNRLLLAGLQRDFAETFELFDRARKRRFQVADVELYDFGTGTLTVIVPSGPICLPSAVTLPYSKVV